ncbi:MAG: DUF4325 domain-containing protein [bacterium]|nr:DUF4325 domain-containing protein [bacterium]
MTITIRKAAGTFAENKDVAREIRIKKIMPAIAKDREIILDFTDVTGATQSFIHALISDAIRQNRVKAFDLLLYKNCSPIVKEIITTVTEYMQES